jgi:hypothetical protein
MQNSKHKSCNRTVKSKLERISFLINNLRDMYHDNCPAIPKREKIGYRISELDAALINLRYEIETKGL